MTSATRMDTKAGLTIWIGELSLDEANCGFFFSEVKFSLGDLGLVLFLGHC